MHVCRLTILMVCVLGSAMGPQARGGHGGAGAPGIASAGQADIAVLPHKLVEWPAPPISAAGIPSPPWNFIQVASVAVSARGTILVLHRGAHPVIEFDTNGTFVRSWGDGLFSEGKVGAIPQAHWTDDKSHYSAVYGPAGCTSCGAHSVRVDPQGNIWLVDATGHVVYKMNPDGKEIMRLGTRGVAGTGPNTFNLPTDVAFAPNGDLYVSDGYGSARIVKYSRDGKYLLQWGTRGKGPAEFGLPHNLVTDAQGKVYVTDRDNQRIQVFDANGTFLTQWTGTGGVSGLAMTRDQRIWTGGILRDLTGKVLGRLSGNTGAHGVAVTESGDVYLAQLSGVVQKFVPAQGAATPPPSPASKRPPQTVTPQTYPAEQIRIGEARFASQCGFCHGRDAAGGESGPDLTRSLLVAEDVRGDKLVPAIRQGRPEKGMPAFSLNDADMAAIVAFIHDAKARADLAGGGRRSVDVEDLQTGDAEAGKRYFNGAGGCAACHSPTGTFATVGARFKGLALLQRMLYPGSGRDAGPSPTPTVTVTTSAGPTVSGKLAYRDEFTISLIDADGWTRSWPIGTVKINVDDPLRAHREHLAKYTDADMHNVLAYLQTLR